MPTSRWSDRGSPDRWSPSRSRRRGRRVAMIERGRHPRFAIGESSTPLANLLLEELADRYDLPRIRAFSKWGTWQRTRPEVAAGLKRGFTFFFHRPGEVFADSREHARQLLVAASPHDEVADTHWYRPDFDQALARDAEAAGVVYLDDTAPRSDPRRGFLRSARGHAPRPIDPDLGGVRGRRQRSARVPPPGVRRPTTRRSAGCLPLRVSSRTSEDVERWDDLQPPRRGAAVSARRCGAPSRFSWRLDLGAAVQQRHHERRCGADRSAGRGHAAPLRARRPGTGF